MTAVTSRQPATLATLVPAGNEIDHLIEGLHIDQIDGVSEAGSNDPAIAIHELISRDVILWGKVLETLLRAYHTGHKDNEALEEMLEIAFDERTQPLTRHILKETLRGKTVSLAALAERRYSSKNPRQAPNFRKLQIYLRNNTLWRMRDIGLWDVFENKSREQVLGYSISAGPLLWLFHERIYFPWRMRQLANIAELIKLES